MPGLDVAIYGVHAAFWASFGLTRVILRVLDRGKPDDAPTGAAVVADQPKTAPYSRALLGFHMLAFAVMYFGLGNAIFPGRVPEWFSGQGFVGTFVIVLGGALMAWSLAYFRSWRFRAKLDQGHQLATGGPFRLMRHPIYMGLNLLALGTAIWVPDAMLWIAFALMAIGSDLRARAEEKLLEQTFGEPYVSYCARTRRFVPGVY